MAMTPTQSELAELLAEQARLIREMKKAQAVRDDAIKAAHDVYAAARDTANSTYAGAVADSQTALDAVEAKLGGSAKLGVEK